MRSNSVIIAGGNIAGLSVALHLAKKQINCEVYESHNQPWSKPCGGGFGTGFGDFLKKEYKELREVPFRFAKTLILASKYKYINLKIPLYVTSRRKLQEGLINAAVNRNIPVKKKKKLYFDRDFDIFQKINVVATGVSGFTRKALNTEFIELGRYQYQLVEDTTPKGFSSTIFYIQPEIKGYSWLFPGIDGKMDVGIGTLEKAVNLEKKYQEFRLWVYRTFDIKIPPVKKFIKWGIPLSIAKPGNAVNFNNGKLFVGVGDSIQLPDPATAAGIEPAWFSGEILAKNIENENKIDLKGYSKDLLEFLIDSNIANVNQRILASLLRNKLMFNLIFHILPATLLEQTVQI